MKTNKVSQDFWAGWYPDILIDYTSVISSKTFKKILVGLETNYLEIVRNLLRKQNIQIKKRTITLRFVLEIAKKNSYKKT